MEAVGAVVVVLVVVAVGHKLVAPIRRNIQNRPILGYF